ncbi:MAG: hypothetical protein ASARMPRED_001823 [Alectoria sarmentosa]|nr:MAG: hypothetical protein ASARMPRED_001823 [Alectoria sarmentosa]
MHPFPKLLIFTKLSFLFLAAQSPTSAWTRNLFLPLDITNNGSPPNLTIDTNPSLSLHLNVTDDSKNFHVPNTYITLIWTPHSDKRIEYKVLRDMISDAINEVTDNIEKFGDIVLPGDRDPYVDDKYAGEAPKGSYIYMRSFKSGPAYGRKLTWGNVRDTLLGLREIMIKQGRPYKIEFYIRNDIVGIIGRGGVIPGKPPLPPPGSGGGPDVQD